MTSHQNVASLVKFGPVYNETCAGKTHKQLRGEGEKYDSKMRSKDCAAAMREDIKMAIATGAIPKVKTSVRYKSFSGGCSIDIRVVAVPEGFVVVNPEYVAWEKDHPHDSNHHAPSFFTQEMKDVLTVLKDIHRAYNHDRSDIMADYFDVKFYGDADVDSDLRRR